MAAKSGAANAPSKAIDVDVESPANKRPGPSHNNPEGTPLTLAIQPLLAKIGNIDTRVGQVETAFTERMPEQVNLLTAITNTQSQHTTDLIAMQQQNKLNKETITSIQQRLTKLESNPPRQPRTNSTTTVEDRAHYGGMGG